MRKAKIKPRTVGRLNRMLEKLSLTLERMNLSEYIRYLNNPKRILWTNFIGGISRGVGIAIGFTILGAILLYILEQSAKANLPVIGNFIAEIVKIVQESPKIKP